MCKKYNAKLREEHEKLEQAENELSRKIVENEIDGCAAAIAVKSLPKIHYAPENLSTGWAYHWRRAFGWVKRATNTSGVYLDFDHPKMQAARRDFQSDLDAGVDRRLYLNVDQVWRSAYSGSKCTFRKDWLTKVSV